jgi:hypothetical protein
MHSTRSLKRFARNPWRRVDTRGSISVADPPQKTTAEKIAILLRLKIFGTTSGTSRNTLRVLGEPSPELEQHLVLRSRASVKVSIYEIQGRIVRYDRAATHETERLIESCEGCNPEGAEIPFDVMTGAQAQI